jgi:gliding-associated putative ABC transporter substrate-binding component GldG
MKRLDKQTAMTNLLIYIAAIVIINLISLNLFFRLDFSKGKIYSLSNASKTAVRQLEDRLVIKAYFTTELPPELANVRRYTRDLLEEYKNYAGSKFRYEFIDPKDENKLKEEAQKSGVPPHNIQVRKSDRLEVQQAYLGLVFHYDGRTETIPLVQESRGLEYEITKTINKVASLGTDKVAFYGLTPDVPDDPRMRFFYQQQDRFQQAKESIRQNYELVNATLTDPIPNDVSVLVFSGVVDSLTTTQLYHLDQFLMNGKNVLFFQDRVSASLQTQQAQAINSNIFDFLKHFGVNILDNLVMDAKSGQVNVQQRQGIFTVNTPMQNPFIPITNDINKRHPIVSQLSNIQFLYVSEIDSTNIAPDIKVTPLIYSSDQSGSVSGPYYNISINQFTDKAWINRLTQKHKILAALYEGRFTSYFADKSFRQGDFIPETYNGKLIVVPNMSFIDSQGAGNNQSNQDFLMNAVDYLSTNQALIALRSREVVNKPLKIERLVNVEELIPEAREKKMNSMRNFVKFANIILPSLLLLLYGFFRYKQEINRRKRIKEIYE